MLTWGTKHKLIPFIEQIWSPLKEKAGTYLFKEDTLFKEEVKNVHFALNDGSLQILSVNIFKSRKCSGQLRLTEFRKRHVKVVKEKKLINARLYCFPPFSLHP